MRFYGQRHGMWRDEKEFGPTSKHFNMKSKKRRHLRRCIKRQERCRVKSRLRKWNEEI